MAISLLVIPPLSKNSVQTAVRTCLDDKAITTTTNSTERDRIHISGVQGDVFGVGFSSSGNIVGKNIVVGSGTINVSKQELSRVDSEYAKALTDFSSQINRELKGQQIPEDQVKDINNKLNELAKEVQDIKPGKEEEISYEKQKNIEAKTGGLMQKVIKVLPTVAQAATAFMPMAPIFSKLIGKGVEQLIDEITKRKNF